MWVLNGPCTTGVLVLNVVFLLSVTTAANPTASQDSQQLQHLRHSVRQHPDNPVPHIQLALALHELHHQVPDGGKRVSEAEQAYRTALSLLAPLKEHASSYMHVQGNLGSLLLSADRPSEALKELQDALTQGKELQHELQQQLKLQRKGKAEQQQQANAVQQLLQEIEQQLGGLHFNLGKALTSVGRLPEAEEAYAAAAAAAAGRDFGSYGKSLAALHSVSPTAAAQAVKVCQAATQRFAKQPHLSFLQDVQQPAVTADTPTLVAAATTESDADADTAGAVATGDWLAKAQSMDLVWLYFALHKYFHHGKQAALAWHYLELGNRIMAAHTGYNPANDQRNLASITAFFKAPFVTSGLQDRTPIFIAGMPRSGSTLLEQMLASHPQVFAAGEDTALAPLTTTINHALASPAPQDHRQMLRHYAEQYLAAMRAKVPPAWQQLQQQQHSQSTSTAGDSPARIVDKMLRNLWLVGYIHMLLPQACIVHVVRHPMDVALSCFAQPFGYSASSLAWAWGLDSIATQLQMTWELAEHWEQQLPGRLITVFYEELVDRPEAVLRQLLSACGLPWDPRVLHFHKTERPVQTASMEQVRQPLYKSSVGRWKQYEQQLEPLRQQLSPLIAQYEQLLQQRRLQASAQQVAAEAGSRPAEQADTARDEL